MMPLNLAQPGEENIIRKIGGSTEVKRHLENLGFVVGGTVRLVNVLGGNVIVQVKEARVALNDEMARKIMI
ncbi:MAG: ferrous iron transport protein A [Ruminococcaceae bacterium]|nr:ferrous iron transport protein A [Oscillospiraceae bacterium]